MMKTPTYNDMINEMNELYFKTRNEQKHHFKDLHDSRVAHVAYDEKMEEFYNEQPTFEETLDALWDGKLEYNTED